MQESWILFLSIFLGILVGGIVGAISLKIIESINNFFKRRGMIIALKIELKLNTLKLIDLKELVIDYLEQSIDINTDIVLNSFKSLKKLSKDCYRLHLNNLSLLKNNRIHEKIIYIYSDPIEDMINIFEFMLVKKVAIHKDILLGIEKLESEFNQFKGKLDIETANNMTEDIQEMKNRIYEFHEEKYKSLADKNKKTIEVSLEIIKEVEVELKKIFNQNIFIYWFSKYKI